MEYARRLAALAPEVSDQLELVMRVYFEKPRTTIGWKGLINDPHLDDSFDVATSQVRYQNPDAKDAASAIGELLGAEVVATQEDLGSADVEVVVGSDLSK
jgi:hypothetical protein